MLMLVLLVLFGVMFVSKCQNLESPCPTLFKYEPPNKAENDRWYGVLTLLSESELNGVWLRVIFDKPSLQLGNWFGAEIVTTDHIEYLLKKPQHKLKPNEPTYVRIFVKYDPNEAPPKLVAFRLNAKTVCPISESTTPAPSTSAQLITSGELSTTTTVRNEVPPREGNAGETNNEDNNTNENTDNVTFENAGTPFQIFGSHGQVQTVNLRVECGTVKVKPKPLITHAESTYEGEFPWHSALYERNGINGWVYICGGSLINSKYVLTAAHCVVLNNPKGTKDPKSMSVHFGKFQLNENPSTNKRIQERLLSEIFVHPEHNTHTLKQDIALLKLAHPVLFTDYIRPICLWNSKRTDLSFIVGKLGTVVGWGIDEKGQASMELGKALIPVVSQETCIFSYPEFYSEFTSPRTFCAGFRNGTSACNGDSGGGMVFQEGGNNAIRWHIRGLVSVSVPLPNDNRCDPSQYVIFTDTAKFVNWIKATVKAGG